MGGIGMRALVIALALIATPAAAAERFDLVCKGKKNTVEHYRIDLDRGEWCSDKCEMIQKISSVTSGLIVLAEHQPGYPGDRTSYNRINRVTGEWEWFHRDPRFVETQDIKGSCEVAPFSGFPDAKRKF